MTAYRNALEIETKMPSSMASIDRLIALVKPDMGRVNDLILARMGSYVQLIPEISTHLVAAGGKRLRPMLTLATASACGYKGDFHILLAAAVEFMHTATLLHDDVVDESDLRRGKPTARRVFGNQASVLVGDFLLGQAFKMMVETGAMECLSVLANAAAIIAEGEVLQLTVSKSLNTTEAEYTQVIEAKTAALFLAATHVGAIISGANAEVCENFKEFGCNLGLSFQIMDDLLDFSGNSQQLGKNTGDDLFEGKVTLPIIKAFAAAKTDAERAFWQRTIEQGDVHTADVAQAIAYIQNSGAHQACVVQAQNYAHAALKCLEKLPQNAAITALKDVVHYNLQRMV